MSVTKTKSTHWYGPLLSLRWRLALVYSALFSLFVILLSIFLYSSTSNLLLNSAQVAFPQRARALRTLLVQEVCGTPSSSQDLGNFLQQNMPIDVDTAYLLDKSGKVVASSNGSLLHLPFPLLAPSFFASAPPNVAHPFNSNPPGNTSSNGLLLSLQAPTTCLAPQRLPSYIVLLTSYSSEQNTLSTILLMLDLTSVFMIVVGALIISFFTGIMFKPLDQVTRATRALAQGDLQQRVPLVQGRDEIAELAASFNQMADRIEQTFAAQQASERRARRFVSDASHELRTPITSLRGFTEVLIRGAKDDPATAQHILSLMKNEAERMTDLVNHLLMLARLDEGHFPTPQAIDLVDVVIGSLQEARKKAPEGYKLALDLVTQDRLQIQADSEQIKQLLLVLLDNAVKYGCAGEQKKILLLLDKRDRQIQIQVIDHGMGIAPDDLPHVFDRFYRGENTHNSTSIPISGTGLGLAIALAITHAYQGTLSVSSQPEKETIFTATFSSAE